MFQTWFFSILKRLQLLIFYHIFFIVIEKDHQKISTERILSKCYISWEKVPFLIENLDFFQLFFHYIISSQKIHIFLGLTTILTMNYNESWKNEKKYLPPPQKFFFFKIFFYSCFWLKNTPFDVCGKLNDEKSDRPRLP